ncbi:hydroxyacid dehydrogenase [Effusibacillus lacus]|uniref:Hydroxyacid dehydrogenase n=1 Tax=Effusibacillus lacus TaxID=1348429 RepID=A0A292YDI9_9BACL|nr:hydroxyacid dehydrogenase [Effusibacillus lacus]TCS72311.1 D-3-phosphoglycerate dehydrogenase/(S)-sulfolactate dehydrogenase [Effusibacillus lacus]GAX90222.1 hypothetical protein EFBL_1848 [Effusibacillus lacus]
MGLVIAEDLWQPLPEWARNKYEIVYDPRLYADRDRLQTVAKSAKALIVRNKTLVDRELLEQLPELRVIGRLGVGLDNIDLETCRERKVKVVAARGCNANAVAEYVIAAMFHTVRPLNQYDKSVRNGAWDRFQCMGGELHGRTLGLIGVGDIGQRVAFRTRSLGIRVIAHDPYVLASNMVVQDFGVHLLPLEEVCRLSDFLSVHVPLTSATRHLIGERELSIMKDTAVLINTSRGGILDESALFKSLKQSPRRYAVLDVREKEPPDAKDSLQELPNVLLTPHIAGITHESSERVVELVLGDIDRVLSGLPAVSAVV